MDIKVGGINMLCEKFDLETKNCKEGEICPFWDEETKTIDNNLVPDYCSVLIEERVRKKNNKVADEKTVSEKQEVKL